MAHDPLFDSAWLKWGRAVMHAQALEDDLEAFSEHGNRDPLQSVRAQYYPERHGFGVVVVEVETIPNRFSLPFGDVAHNFRSALDNLAWALVSRGTTPPGSGKLTPDQERSVYFPYAASRVWFNAQIKEPTGGDRLKLPGVRRADSAKVRARQPYHYSAQNRPMHVLELLASVDNSDKHRTIQPLWTQPTIVNIEITDARDCEVPALGWKRNKDPLEPGTELAFIRASKAGPKPELDVKVNVTAKPSIGNRIALDEWTTRAALFVSRLLIDFSDTPDALLQVGADLPRLMAMQQALGL
jgi:hypothetical protein